MALQDILDAISAEADRQIAAARADHQKRMVQQREEYERSLAKTRQELAMQKEQKKEQMRNKTLTHTATERKNMLLQKKWQLLEKLYADALDTIAKLPEKQTEEFLRACLKSIRTEGTLHPSPTHAALLKRLAPSEQFTLGKELEDSKGGFLFKSKDVEEDFTFESLVKTALRSRTELDIVHMLFRS